MGFQGSAPPPDVIVNVDPAGATVQNNVTATLPADLTTTNLYGARIFGNGSDGDVVIPGGSSVTLTRDMQYASLTIEAGATLCAAGYMVKVAGSLLVFGKLHNEGGKGGIAVVGTINPVPGGAGGLAGRFLGGAVGAPGKQMTSGAGPGSLGGAPTSGTDPVYVVGGRGGNGGSVAGGAGGLSAIVETWEPMLVMDTQTMRTQKFTGGGGAGSGASSAQGGAKTSAGGGGGGGILPVFAKAITNAGTISARGGDGGDSIDTYSGAGGGGGGGVIVLVYTTFTGNSPDYGGGAGGVQNTPHPQPTSGAFGHLVEIVAKL